MHMTATLDDSTIGGTSPEERRPCGTLEPSPALVPVFERAIEEDPLSGFGGLPVQIELKMLSTIPTKIKLPKGTMMAKTRRKKENPCFAFETVSQLVHRYASVPSGRCTLSL